MNEVESLEYKGYNIKVVYDDYPEDPRTWDNIGTIACWHSNYQLGDYTKVKKEPDKYLYSLMQNWYKDETVEEWYNEKGFTEFIEFCIDKLSEHAIVFPLVLYDHSGITMKIGNSFACDPGSWDTSRVGFIFATYEDIKKNWGLKKITKKYKEWTERLLEAEVETYDRYLTGNVYGLIIEDDEIDSCWGFYYDTKDVINEGKLQVDAHIRYEEKQRDFQLNNFNIQWVMA